MDYRIFNISLYTRRITVYSLTRRTLVESAQNVTPEKPRGWRKAWHVTVNRGFQKLDIMMMTVMMMVAFVSRYSPLSSRLTALFVARDSKRVTIAFYSAF